MLIDQKVQAVSIIERSKETDIIETTGGSGKAIVYNRLFPKVQVGDWLIVNTTAHTLSLGTGGIDIVRSIIGKTHTVEPNGHIMKLRYLPSQHALNVIEAQESDNHSYFIHDLDLQGKAIFVAELHSMLPIIFRMMTDRDPNQKIVVIFGDEASIPICMSEHLRDLSKNENVISITTGHSFGGTYEALNIITAIQFAYQKFKGAFILVTLGPGVVGSETMYGFSGIALAEWVNHIGSLGGCPVWIPRLSSLDSRDRHKGISHHTKTPLTKLTHKKTILPIPEGEFSTPWIQDDLRIIESYQHIELRKFQERQLYPIIENILNSTNITIYKMGKPVQDDFLYLLGVASAIKWQESQQRNNDEM